jgi:cytochrome c-type biogenesis protein
MFEIEGVSIFLAFAAGVLSVLSPCVLPLVPAYLGYLTGSVIDAPAQPAPVAVSAGSGSAAIAVAGAPPRDEVGARPPSPFLHSVAFVSGFTTVFVLFGIALGIVGYFLKDNDDLILKIAGGVLIVMGLHLAGVITIPILDQERRLDAGRGARIGYARSFVVGAAFSAGWSPCIGPTLGAIYALAVTSGTVAQAGILLLTYSAGLSIPFLAMGAAYGAMKPLYSSIKRHIWIINYLSGAMLIVVGILIFTDSLINMNELFNFGVLQDVSGDV